MKIFLSGCAGHLAQALLPKLCHHPAVESVVGVDLLPATFRHARFTGYQLDYASPAACALLAGCDGLVHLGFTVLRGRMDAQQMWQNNVAGSKILFEAAQVAGVVRVVHVSSAAVYGGGENLCESAPLLPQPDFLYARHKAELERWLKEHLPQAVCLRPHIILGPHALPLLRFLLRQPFHLRLPAPQPLLQCVHEEDVAQAILLCLSGTVAGPFNLAAPEAFTFRDAVRARHAYSPGLPPWLARMVLQVLWRMTGAGGEPGWLAAANRSFTLDCSRARRELGWQPHHTAAEAIRAAAS